MKRCMPRGLTTPQIAWRRSSRKLTLILPIANLSKNLISGVKHPARSTLALPDRAPGPRHLPRKRNMTYWECCHCHVRRAKPDQITVSRRPSSVVDSRGTCWAIIWRRHKKTLSGCHIWLSYMQKYYKTLSRGAAHSSIDLPPRS